LLTLGLIVATVGCATLPAPPAAQVPLDAAEDRALLACQGTMTRASTKLVGTALRKLDRCAGRAIALRLEEDRRLNSQTIAEFVARRALVLERCNADFARIGAASTRMVDAVVAACAPVEDLLLLDDSRGDPLSFRTLSDVLGALGYANLQFAGVPELAGLLCGADLAAAREALALHLPRVSDVARSYLGFDMDELGEHLHGFADPRCKEI